MSVFMNPAFEIKDLTYELGFITSDGEFQSDNSKLTVQFRVLQQTYDSYGKTMYFEVMGLNNLKAECYKVLINGTLYSSTDLSDSTKVVFSELSRASSYIAIQFSNRDGSYFKEEDMNTIFNKDVTIRMYSNERKQPSSIYIGVPTYNEKAYQIRSSDLYGSSSSSYYINSSGYVSDSSKKNISTVSLFPKSQLCDYVDITYDATNFNIYIHCFNITGEYIGKISKPETAVQYGSYLKSRFNCINNTSYIKITLTKKDGTFTNGDYVIQISKVRIYDKNEDNVGVAKKISAIYAGNQNGMPKLVYRSKAKEPSINTTMSFSPPSNLYNQGAGYTKDYAIYTCGYYGNLSDPGETYVYDKNLSVKKLSYPFVVNDYRIYDNASATNDTETDVIFAGAKYKEKTSTDGTFTTINTAFKYDNNLSCTYLAGLSQARCPGKSAYFYGHYIFAGGCRINGGSYVYSDIVDMYDDDFTLTTLSSKLLYPILPNCATLKDEYCFISNSPNCSEYNYSGSHYIDKDFTLNRINVSVDGYQDMVAATKDYILIQTFDEDKDYDTYIYSYHMYSIDKDKTINSIPYFGDEIWNGAETYSSDDYAMFIGGSFRAGKDISLGGSFSEQIKIINNDLTTKIIDNGTDVDQYLEGINKAKNKLLVKGKKQNFIINI